MRSIRSREGSLLLRSLRPDDREEYLRVHEVSREHFAPWMSSWGPALTPGTLFEEELRRTEAEATAGTGVRLVGELQDGRIAGFFTLSQIFRRAFQSAYAGWSVSADEIGRGIATEGVIALLDLAFSPPPEGLGLHRVQANVIPSNQASVRVAQKAGFRLEGIAKAYLRIGGEWRDHLMFAKLVDEHRAEGEESS
jgi:ribosomal-protein-alanine N-acetyltransferase